MCCHSVYIFLSVGCHWSRGLTVAITVVIDYGRLPCYKSLYPNYNKMRQKKNPSQSTHTRLESANKYTVLSARLGKQRNI